MRTIGYALRVSLRQYYVCVLSNHSRTLYVGVTNDLPRRTLEHKSKTIESFAARYNLGRAPKPRTDHRARVRPFVRFNATTARPHITSPAATAIA